MIWMLSRKLIKSIVFLSFISLFNVVNHVSSVIVQLFKDDFILKVLVCYLKYALFDIKWRVPCCRK
jgi:hypothetical protein